MANVANVEAGAAAGIESGRPWSLGPTTSRTVTDARVPDQSRAADRPRARWVSLAVVGDRRAGRRDRGAGGQKPARRGAPAAATLAAAPHEHGVIAIASAPAGAAIFVNGELSPQTTPATLTNVALGVPFVVALAADGFEPASQTVTLTEVDPSSAISVILAPVTPDARGAQRALETVREPPSREAAKRFVQSASGASRPRLPSSFSVDSPLLAASRLGGSPLRRFQRRRWMGRPSAMARRSRELRAA